MRVGGRVNNVTKSETNVAKSENNVRVQYKITRVCVRALFVDLRNRTKEPLLGRVRWSEGQVLMAYPPKFGRRLSCGHSPEVCSAHFCAYKATITHFTYAYGIV